MDIKQTFILREVQRYIQDCEAAMKDAIRKKKVGVTDDLINSIRSQSRTNGSGATAELLFKQYGRYVDMGVGKSNPLGGLAQTKVALKSRQYEGLAFVKKKTRIGKRIYSPIIYGKLSYLQGRLLFGLTEETINSLKAELTQK